MTIPQQLARRGRDLVGAAIALALAIPAPCAQSATATSMPAVAATHRPVSIIVGNCNDSGAGSLRDAIASAASGDTVDLSSLTCSTITLSSGQLEVPEDDLTVKYSGEGVTPPTIDGNLGGRVFHHTGSGTLKLVGLTIENGKYDNTNVYQLVAASGGCIYTSGSVYLVGSSVTGCTARDTRGEDASGGGVYAIGSATVFHSIVTGNTATSSAQSGDGGGVFSRSYVDVEYSSVSGNTASGINFLSSGGGICVISGSHNLSSISHSTIAGNHADHGGALLVSGSGSSGAPIDIIDSTLSGNTATSYAALYLNGPLNLLNSTIAFNTASSGPAVEIASTEYAIALLSSIVADNTTSGGAEYDIGDRGASVAIGGANNLVMRWSGVVLPADTLSTDPLLGPLADNGGPTLTHEPAAGSPAIGAGNNAGALDNDQRGPGYPRSVDATTDIGAFERQTDSDTIFVDGFDG